MKTETPKDTPGTGPAKKRRRRWPIITLVIVVALLWSIPYLVSSGPGESLAATLAGRFSPQNIQFTNLSLTWLGPTEISGLHISDPPGQRDIKITKVVWSKGLWRAITGATNFDQLSVENLQATLPMESAPAAPKDKKEKPAPPASDKPAKMPQPKGHLTLKGGSVRLTHTDGRSYEIHDIHADIQVDTLDHINGSFGLIAGTDGKIDGQLKVDNLSLGVEQMQAEINVKNEGSLDLKPLLTFALSDVDAGGQVQFSLRASADKGMIQSDYDINMTGVQAGYRQEAAVHPIDMRLTGQVQTNGKKIDGYLGLSGTIGQMASKFSWQMPEQPQPIIDPGANMLNIVQGQGTLHLPECHVETEGQFDLAALSRSIPALLSLKPGLDIQSGLLIFQEVRFDGGAAPTLRGGVRLNPIIATYQQQSIQISPVIANFDLSWQPKIGAQISQARIGSDFLTLVASGNSSRMGAKFQGDLTKLSQQLAYLTTAKLPSWAGQFDGQVDVTKITDGYDLATAVTLKDIAYTTDQGTLRVAQGHLLHESTLTLKDDQPDQFRIKKTDIDLGEALQVQATGWLQMANQAFHAEVAVPQLQLGQLGLWAEQLGQKDLSRYDGRVSFKSTIDQAGAKGTLVASGEGAIRQFTVKDTPQAEPLDVEFRWAELRWEPGQDTILLKAAELDSWLSGVAKKASVFKTKMDGAVKTTPQQTTIDLDGTYQASWSQITPWLQQAFPEDFKDVVLEGDSQGSFAAHGPLNQVGVQPPFRNLKASVNAGWVSANIFGLLLGTANLQPRFQDGRLEIPDADIPAAPGKVLAGGILDFSSGQPVLQLKGNRKILYNLPVTRELGNSLLSRFNPIFANLAGVEGSILLETQDIVLPLGEGRKTGGSGHGKIVLSNLKMIPTGLMADLLGLGGIMNDRPLPMEVGDLNFEIKDGAIHYDDFRITIAQLMALRFRGSVGFDDTVRLWVSVPLSVPLLDKLGIKAPALVQDNIDKLRVEIPILGDRRHAKLDSSKVKAHDPSGATSGESGLEALGGILGALQKALPLIQEKDGDRIINPNRDRERDRDRDREKNQDKDRDADKAKDKKKDNIKDKDQDKDKATDRDKKVEDDPNAPSPKNPKRETRKDNDRGDNKDKDSDNAKDKHKEKAPVKDKSKNKDRDEKAQDRKKDEVKDKDQGKEQAKDRVTENDKENVADADKDVIDDPNAPQLQDPNVPQPKAPNQEKKPRERRKRHK